MSPSIYESVLNSSDSLWEIETACRWRGINRHPTGSSLYRCSPLVFHSHRVSHSSMRALFRLNPILATFLDAR